MPYKHAYFGLSVHNNTIGESWLEVLNAVPEYGETTFDEGRKRSGQSHLPPQ